jgi:hypothetical protein
MTGGEVLYVRCRNNNRVVWHRLTQEPTDGTYRKRRLRSTMDQNPLILVFTALYLFAVREAVKTAASWGAFHFHYWRALPLKVIAFSLTLIVLLPMLMYPLFVRAVATVQIDLTTWKHLGAFIISGFALFLAGLFPRGTKHLWLLVARSRFGSFPEPWIGPRVTDPNTVFLHPWYSIQVLAILGVVPAALTFWRLSSADGFPTPNAQDVYTVLVGLYASQLAVFFHLAKTRDYLNFYPNQKLLVNGRQLLTIVSVVVVPLLFGLAWVSWVRWLLKESAFAHLVYWVYIGGALAFPYFTNGFIFQVARSRNWAHEDRRPDLYRGVPDAWPIGSTVMAAVLIVIMCLITLRAPSGFRDLAQSDLSNSLLRPKR